MDLIFKKINGKCTKKLFSQGHIKGPDILKYEDRRIKFRLETQTDKHQKFNQMFAKYSHLQLCSMHNIKKWKKATEMIVT